MPERVEVEIVEARNLGMGDEIWNGSKFCRVRSILREHTNDPNIWHRKVRCETHGGGYYGILEFIAHQPALRRVTA